MKSRISGRSKSSLDQGEVRVDVVEHGLCMLMDPDSKGLTRLTWTPEAILEALSQKII